MKKQFVKRLITLFTLVCVMSTVFVLPSQAATLSPVTPTTTVIHTAAPLTSLIHPMDPIQSWTESTQFRTYTSTYFQAAEMTQIANTLQKVFLGPLSTYTIPATTLAAAWYTLEGHNAYEIVYYYWTPSNIPYSPYYIKKHIDYYSNSARTNLLSSSDNYYYSTVPW